MSSGGPHPDTGCAPTRPAYFSAVWRNPLLVRAVRMTGITYLSAVGVLAVFQRSLIYHPPSPTTALALEVDAARLGFQPWRAPDGTEIGLASAGPATPRAVVLLCYGNANCAGRWAGDAARLVARGWDVRIVEYPGYGRRPGTPTETSLVDASVAAAEQAAADARAARVPFFVLAESLGTGVACQVAARRPDLVRLLGLIIPFDQLATPAAEHYPWLPVRWILRDRYDSVAALKDWPGALVVGVAGRDEVIPPSSGRRLFDSFPGPKHLVELPEAGHWSRPFLDNETFWQHINARLPEPLP